MTKERDQTGSGRPLIKAAELARSAEVEIRHPFNPNSEVHLKRLGQPTGLQRLSLSIGRVPPGKESFVYHAHERDEEFLFILSGRGLAEIGEETVEVGRGDFMGFPAPSVGHHLKNPFTEDLIYLMGGEKSGFDIGRYPRIGKQIIFARGTITCIDEKNMTPMRFEQWLPR